VIGGSAGIWLGAARRARAEGADVILTGRNPGRLPRPAAKIGARQTGAFDANDPAALDRFFQACRPVTRDGRRRIGDTGAARLSRGPACRLI
jgi:short-subunit dehydrogenase involved in D-alanine esterification of teichoic acids